MTKPLGIALESMSPLTVLSVSPAAEDDQHLNTIGKQAAWTLLRSHDLPAALALLKQHCVPVVLCERDLPSGTWLDLLKHLRNEIDPPMLIVTSRLADDCLWAEALNLGAFDVLARPFDRTEVTRSVMLAWLHWRQMSAPAVRRLSAAS